MGHILEYIGQHSPELFKWWRWWRFWVSISNYVMHHVSPKQTPAVATREDSIVGRWVLLSIPSDITLLGTASSVLKKCGVGNLEVWFALVCSPILRQFVQGSFKLPHVTKHSYLLNKHERKRSLFRCCRRWLEAARWDTNSWTAPEKVDSAQGFP